MRKQSCSFHKSQYVDTGDVGKVATSVNSEVNASISRCEYLKPGVHSARGTIVLSSISPFLLSLHRHLPHPSHPLSVYNNM